MSIRYPKPMEKTVPLLMTVHKLDDAFSVYLEPSSPADIESLIHNFSRVDEGDWVLLKARVREVRRIGGYSRGPSKDDEVRRYEMFSLDTASIFLTGIQ